MPPMVPLINAGLTKVMTPGATRAPGMGTMLAVGPLALVAPGVPVAEAVGGVDGGAVLAAGLPGVLPGRLPGVGVLVGAGGRATRPAPGRGAGHPRPPRPP